MPPRTQPQRPGDPPAEPTTDPPAADDVVTTAADDTPPTPDPDPEPPTGEPEARADGMPHGPPTTPPTGADHNPPSIPIPDDEGPVQGLEPAWDPDTVEVAGRPPTVETAQQIAVDLGHTTTTSEEA